MVWASSEFFFRLFNAKHENIDMPDVKLCLWIMWNPLTDPKCFSKTIYMQLLIECSYHSSIPLLLLTIYQQSFICGFHTVFTNSLCVSTYISISGSNSVFTCRNVSCDRYYFFIHSYRMIIFARQNQISLSWIFKKTRNTGWLVHTGRTVLPLVEKNAHFSFELGNYSCVMYTQFIFFIVFYKTNLIFSFFAKFGDKNVPKQSAVAPFSRYIDRKW